MSKYGPASSFLLVGGRDISGEVFNLTESIEQDMEQTNGLGTTWEEHKPFGLAKLMLEAGGGFYEDAVGKLNESLQGLGTTQQLVAYGMSGSVVNSECTIVDGAFAATFKRAMTRGGLTQAEGSYVMSGRPYRAVVLHGRNAETSDPGNTRSTPQNQLNAPRLESRIITANSLANPTVVTSAAHGLITGDVVSITGSNSTPTIDGVRTVTVTGVNTFTVAVNVTVAGTTGAFQKLTSTDAVADLHLLALTLGGYTNLAVSVEHSADNATYIPLTTFAVRTATGAERKIVTGQVQQYTAMAWDWTGAGSGQSAIPFVALSR